MERRHARFLMDRRIAGRGGGRGIRPGFRRDRGMVTAELAVGIMSVVGVIAMVLAAVGIGIAHVRTQEAARAGARAAARGDSSGNIRSIAQKAMPGSRVKISRGGDRVSVEVAIKVTVPFLRGAGVNVAATSTAEEEPL